jgi:hypothetical protein
MDAAWAYYAYDGILPFQCICKAGKSVFGANDEDIGRMFGCRIDSCDYRDVEAGAA